MVKFSSFSILDREFRDCFASKAYQLNTSEIPVKFSQEANQRDTSKNFQISFLKGFLWGICFKHLSSSLKPLF